MPYYVSPQKNLWEMSWKRWLRISYNLWTWNFWKWDIKAQLFYRIKLPCLQRLYLESPWPEQASFYPDIVKLNWDGSRHVAQKLQGSVDRYKKQYFKSVTAIFSLLQVWTFKTTLGGAVKGLSCLGSSVYWNPHSLLLLPEHKFGHHATPRHTHWAWALVWTSFCCQCPQDFWSTNSKFTTDFSIVKIFSKSFANMLYPRHYSGSDLNNVHFSTLAWCPGWLQTINTSAEVNTSCSQWTMKVWELLSFYTADVLWHC